MSWLEAIPLLGIPWWLGYLLVRGRGFGLGLDWRDDPWAYCGWIHVTGCLGTALYLVVWLLAGLPLHATAVVPLAGLCAWLHWQLHRWRQRHDPPPPDHQRVPAPRWQRVLFGGVAAAVLCNGAASIASGNAWAIHTGDEVLHWTLKAKMIYAAGGLGAEFEQLAAEKHHPHEFWQPYDDLGRATWPLLPEEIKRRVPNPGDARGYHLDYPLLNPLLHVWAFTCAGEILHWQNRLLIQGFGLALLLILAGALRRQASPLLAAALLVMVFSMQETRSVLQSSYADGMLATGLLLAVDGLMRYRTGGPGQARWWRLAVVGLAVMVWSKNEGLMYLAAIVVGAVSVGLRPSRSAAGWLALPLVLIALTWISNAVFGFRNDLATMAASGGIERLGEVLRFFCGAVYTGAAWSPDAVHLAGNWLYPMFFVLLLLAPRTAFAAPLRLLTVSLVLFAVMHLLVYVYTPHKLHWHLQESALRVVWQTMPAVALWLGRAGVANLKS